MLDEAREPDLTLDQVMESLRRIGRYVDQANSAGANLIVSLTSERLLISRQGAPQGHGDMILYSDLRTVPDYALVKRVSDFSARRR